MSIRFIDTNVLLRYLTRDDERMARASLDLLLSIESGQQSAIASPLVIFETVFTLQSFYRIDREQIRSLLAPIIALDGLQLDGKTVFLHALDIYVDVNVSFADSFNAAFMMARGIDEVYTWDRGIDRIEGILRIEPPVEDEHDDSADQ